jgi:tetratricopeptide (TPR) repeat protein
MKLKLFTHIATLVVFCFTIPGKTAIAQDSLAYKPSGFSKITNIVSGKYGNNLAYKIYLPENIKGKLPVVFFINGGGGNVTEWNQYIDWPKAAATKGLIGIAYEAERNNSKKNTEELFDLLTTGKLHPAIDVDNIVLWACSSNGIVGMEMLMNKNYRNIKGASLYYPVIDYKGALRTDIKIELVRAGLDALQLNEKIDNWIPIAIRNELDISIINFPGGRHAFDMFDATQPQTSTIIANTLQFLKTLAYGDVKVSNPGITPNLLFTLLDEGKIAEAEKLYATLENPANLSREDKFYNGLYNSNSLNRMSTILLENKKFEAALIPQGWTLNIDPKHPNTHDNLAELYFKMGDNVMALKHSKLALTYLESFQHPNQQFINAIRESSTERIKKIGNQRCLITTFHKWINLIEDCLSSEIRILQMDCNR